MTVRPSQGNDVLEHTLCKGYGSVFLVTVPPILLLV
jgi:hypothetical protein